MKFTFTIRSLLLGFIISLLCVPAAHAATPRQSTVTYSQRHALWDVSATGNPSQVLMSVNAQDLAWSPNGLRLAYVNTTSDTLETVNKNGANRRIIVAPSFCQAVQPAWSGQGDRIAFSCTRTVQEHQQSALFIFTVPTEQLNNVTGWSRTKIFRSPSWSPDGTRLVYEASTNRGAYLYVTDWQRHTTRQLVALSDTTLRRQISWSPSGKKILYNDSADELYTIWPDSTHRSTIADGDSYEGSWSPDGSRIAFIEDADDDTISLSEPDGSIVQLPLSAPMGKKSNPRWSPDGSKIAFTIGGTKGGLFVIDVATHQLAKLAAHPIDSFVWHPPY